jgi:hypothetical protein
LATRNDQLLAPIVGFELTGGSEGDRNAVHSSGQQKPCVIASAVGGFHSNKRTALLSMSAERGEQA